MNLYQVTFNGIMTTYRLGSSFSEVEKIWNDPVGQRRPIIKIELIQGDIFVPTNQTT